MIRRLAPVERGAVQRVLPGTEVLGHEDQLRNGYRNDDEASEFALDALNPSTLYATTGDGALAALKTIECIKTYDKPLKELLKEVALFPQVLKNAKVQKKPEFESVASIKKALDEVNSKMGEKGRVVLRYSGTEPLARVMVEGEDEKLVREVCDQLVDVVSKELS